MGSQKLIAELDQIQADSLRLNFSQYVAAKQQFETVNNALTTKLKLLGIDRTTGADYQLDDNNCLFEVYTVGSRSHLLTVPHLIDEGNGSIP